MTTINSLLHHLSTSACYICLSLVLSLLKMQITGITDVLNRAFQPSLISLEINLVWMRLRNWSAYGRRLNWNVPPPIGKTPGFLHHLALVTPKLCGVYQFISWENIRCTIGRSRVQTPIWFQLLHRLQYQLLNSWTNLTPRKDRLGRGLMESTSTLFCCSNSIR
ncbi:uncharacterized protein LOC135170710 [Diachasmimorpha longicaudata]|uniref:uncharacterized protein LOC135170710 n=1 Tax=Diachasmimorpha longicaudata TaxID=58733 RepID=UPI0030B875B1